MEYKESFITKPEAVATISILSCTAGAAATGRRFKSCRPDFLACESPLTTSAATTIRVARASRVLVFGSRESELYNDEARKIGSTFRYSLELQEMIESSTAADSSFIRHSVELRHSG